LNVHSVRAWRAKMCTQVLTHRP
jgi:hypothetical protein